MYQIGIDIGGTNVKIGLLDETLEWNVAFPVSYTHLTLPTKLEV